jgi:sulfide:quinone oxidoreductase
MIENEETAMTEPQQHVDHGSGGDRFRVLIAGGGVAGLEAAFALQELAGDRLRLTLLAPADEFVYRPAAIGEPFTSGWARRFSLAKLAAEAGAELVPGAAAEVDAQRRVVRTVEGAELSYDALLVCPGAKLHHPYEHATGFDDSRMDELLHGLVQDLEQGYVKRLAIVVPAPMGWPMPAYEFALMASERAWDMGAEMEITVFTPETGPLAVFGGEASLGLSRLLAERGVDVVTSAYCEIPRAKTVIIHPGGRAHHADRIVSLPALSGPGLAGLPQDGNGFIPIDEYGRVSGVDAVWAAGDATDLPIKLGGVAAQLADTVAASIAARAGEGAEPPPFEPILEGVLLTGGTPRYLRNQPTGVDGERSVFTELPRDHRTPKIAARYLTPHMVGHESSPVRGR